MFAYEVVFAPTVASWPHGPLDEVARWISNPLSSSELSSHARSIPLEDTVVAVRLLGESGTVAIDCVVALAVFE